MILPETRELLCLLEGGVLRLTLNRPEARNAMTRGMVAELEAVFAAVRDAREVRVIVLRGAGGHFSAGGDLKEMLAGGLKPPVAGEADPVAVNSRRFGAMLRTVGKAPQVVIAICEGAVLGGGFGLACVSDIAFAKHDAKFGLPETTRGLPPAQIAPFVVERIGLTAARRLCLTGALFDGAEAQRLGIVHESFADEAELAARLSAVLGQVLSCAPGANAMTKEIILNVARQDMDFVLDDAARKFAAAVRGAEAPEGIGAFMQKRAPNWANPA
ncbi:MAG: isohexenylglutaconyl-CoA hydratase [Nevskia sp.]